MPGIVMHHHLGQVVYCSLNEEVKQKIESMDLFDLGLAGPDLFGKIRYFNKNKNEEYYDTATIFHTQDTQKYFLHLIEETKKDYELFSYLCGQVAHYYLDLITNPFIYYFSGVYDPTIDNTLKYRGMKEKLMQEMDAYCIDNYYQEKPEYFNITKKILRYKKFDESFKEELDRIYLEAYQLKDGFNLVNKSIKASRKFYNRTFDPIGFKTVLFNFLDNGKSKTVYNQITLRNKLVDIKHVDIFNMNSKLWVNPMDEMIKSNLSFFDLFDGAKTATYKCINDLYRLIFNEEQIDLNYYFNNTFYLTGESCDKGCAMKFFANNL